MYKGILLDIDNTLYQYQPLHDMAQTTLLEYIQGKYSRNATEVAAAFSQAKMQIKQNTPQTASSHNRLLYIQNLCEILQLDSLSHSLDFYNVYWDTFLAGLSLTPGAVAFFQDYGHLPICLLTDLTAHIQHRKVAKLELNRWANFMVTSEEAG